jgi:hypothetical protein
MTIPSELLSHFAHGDVVVFVGAGLSKGAKLPGWIDLMRPLAKAVKYRLPDDDALITAEALLEVAQAYNDEKGPNELIRCLRAELGKNVRLTSVHRLLARFRLDLIFTTNYDDLIERTFQSASKPVHTVVTDIDVAFWSRANMQVVKLCGSLNQAESIIITRDQFREYFTTRDALARRLRTELESKTALFLGYNLKDPFFNQIWSNIGLDFGDLRRRGYAVMFNANRATTSDLARRGIKVINLRAKGRAMTSRLAEWLHDLQNALIRKHGGRGLALKPGKQPRPVQGTPEAPDPIRVPPHGPLIGVMLNGKRYQAKTLPKLYEAVLPALVDQGHLAKLQMPVATSARRYLVSHDPVHPNGTPFFRAVSYGGYHLEANKSRKGGLSDLKWLIKKCGLAGKG